MPLGRIADAGAIDRRVQKGAGRIHRVCRGVAGSEYTGGATLEEARANLTEAIQMVLEANRTLAQESLEGQDVIREPVTITAA
jgi:hypothetical protein